MVRVPILMGVGAPKSLLNFLAWMIRVSSGQFSPNYVAAVQVPLTFMDIVSRFSLKGDDTRIIYR